MPYARMMNGRRIVGLALVFVGSGAWYGRVAAVIAPSSRNPSASP